MIKVRIRTQKGARTASLDENMPYADFRATLAVEEDLNESSMIIRGNGGTVTLPSTADASDKKVGDLIKRGSTLMVSNSTPTAVSSGWSVRQSPKPPSAKKRRTTKADDSDEFIPEPVEEEVAAISTKQSSRPSRAAAVRAVGGMRAMIAMDEAKKAEEARKREARKSKSSNSNIVVRGNIASFKTSPSSSSTPKKQRSPPVRRTRSKDVLSVLSGTMRHGVRAGGQGGGSSARDLVRSDIRTALSLRQDEVRGEQRLRAGLAREFQRLELSSGRVRVWFRLAGGVKKLPEGLGVADVKPIRGWVFEDVQNISEEEFRGTLESVWKEAEGIVRGVCKRCDELVENVPSALRTWTGNKEAVTLNNLLGDVDAVEDHVRATFEQLRDHEDDQEQVLDALGSAMRLVRNLAPSTMAATSPRMFWALARMEHGPTKSSLATALPEREWSWVDVRIRSRSDKGQKAMEVDKAFEEPSSSSSQKHPLFLHLDDMDPNTFAEIRQNSTIPAPPTDPTWATLDPNSKSPDDPVFTAAASYILAVFKDPESSSSPPPAPTVPDFLRASASLPTIQQRIWDLRNSWIEQAQTEQARQALASIAPPETLAALASCGVTTPADVLDLEEDGIRQALEEGHVDTAQASSLVDQARSYLEAHPHLADIRGQWDI